MSGVSKSYSELYSKVRNDAAKFQLQWRSALKIGAVQNWLQTQPIFFSDGIKKTRETLESVLWSRGGLRWKLILDSFLYIYNKCAFFWNVPSHFDLTSDFISFIWIHKQWQKENVHNL
jgi:hypothetical protein